MTCYNLIAFIGGKFILKKYPLQGLLSSLNAVISTNESARIITGLTGHVFITRKPPKSICIVFIKKLLLSCTYFPIRSRISGFCANSKDINPVAIDIQILLLNSWF